MARWWPLRSTSCAFVTSRPRWNAAPGVPCTQWSGQSTCVPYESSMVSKGFFPGCDEAKEAWPRGCQSWVRTTFSKRAARRLAMRHHLVAFGHGERAARDEVVLHVDHHQAGVALHFLSPTISTSARSAAV